MAYLLSKPFNKKCMTLQDNKCIINCVVHFVMFVVTAEAEGDYGGDEDSD